MGYRGVGPILWGVDGEIDRVDMVWVIWVLGVGVEMESIEMRWVRWVWAPYYGV